MPEARTVTIEGVQLLFPNFSGKETQYNDAGNRNFNIILTPEMADDLSQRGFNVKERPGREEGDPSQFTLQIKVNFQNRPPRIVMITSSGRTNLNEHSVEVLDWADIQYADLIISPYHWEGFGGKSGVTAYLQSLYATIEEDDLERKYAHIDSAEDEI
jgi:hypothetical protein